MSQPMVVAICDECGSADVKADAFASWDVHRQDWVCEDTFDKGSVCEDCDGECRLDTREATPEEIAEAARNALPNEQDAALRAALEEIAKQAPDVEPEEEDYDDTESAYNNGHDVAAWRAAEIARKALRGRSRS